MKVHIVWMKKTVEPRLPVVSHALLNPELGHSTGMSAGFTLPVEFFWLSQ